MDFINPTFLGIAAIGATLPILIHLIWRNKTVRIDFAAMRFLLNQHKPMTRWLRLKQLLLLLLRVLALGMLGFAFARPWLPSRSDMVLWKKGNREVGIIYDVSASMRAGNNRSGSVRALRSVLSGMKNGDLVSVYLNGAPEPLLIDREPWSAALLRDIVSRAKPTQRSGNLIAGLRLLDDQLVTSELAQREIYIISDFQKNNWPVENLTIELNSKASLHLLPVREEPWKNVAITGIALPQRNSRTWSCRIRNDSPEDIRRATISLYVDGRRAARKQLVFEPDETTRLVRFSGISMRPGQNQTGYFSITAPGDEFEPDDKRYFVLHRDRSVSVLLVNGEKSAGAGDELFFARRAFATSSSDFRLQETTPETVQPARFRAYDVVILANVKGMNSRKMNALRAFVENGGGLFIAPGDRVDAALFNKFFAGLSPLLLRKKAEENIDLARGHAVLVQDFSHPVIETISAPGSPGMGAARVYQYWQGTAQPGAQVVAVLDGDHDPALAFKSVGRGKVALLSFPLDVEWSNLPLKPSYLPLLLSISQWLKQARDAADALRVGEPIFLLRVSGRNERVVLTLPDESTERMHGGDELFTATEQAGIYTLRFAGRTRHFAVNIHPGEGQPDFFTPSDFNALVQTHAEVRVQGEVLQAGSPGGMETESRQKLWRIVLMLLIALLLAEAIWANRVPR